MESVVGKYGENIMNESSRGRDDDNYGRLGKACIRFKLRWGVILITTYSSPSSCVAISLVVGFGARYESSPVVRVHCIFLCDLHLFAAPF